MARAFLPYGRQSIDDSDIEAVTAVLRGDWLTTGPSIDALEASFAATVGAGHAVACSNGTTALHLALAAEGVGPGDICIVPAITFMATANAALYCGAEVVFADVDPDTGLMTPATLAKALDEAGDAARVALPVHLAGQCEAMGEMADLAAKAGAVLVEDACHAVGSKWQDRPVGNCRLSRAATFSFHPVKTIAAGEGGMVTTNDAALARRMKNLRSHGIERETDRHQRQADEPWWHEMQALGWNYRLSDIQAALALSQLKRLDAFAARRQALAAAYDAALAGNDLGIEGLARTPDCDPCLHLYPVRIDFQGAAKSRAVVMAELAAQGVGSQVHYIPVCDQPFYKARYGQADMPGARRYYARTLSLPLFVGMADEDPARVVSVLSDVLGS